MRYGISTGVKNTLRIENNDYQLTFDLILESKTCGSFGIYYNPCNVTDFLASEFFDGSNLLNVRKILFEGLFKIINGDMFVNFEGLKYILSSFISNRLADERCPSLSYEQSKFVNWILKTDLDILVKKSLQTPDLGDEFNYFSKFQSKSVSSELISSSLLWFENVENQIGKSSTLTKKSPLDPKYHDPNYISYLSSLLLESVEKLKDLLAIEQIISIKGDEDALLTDYSPSEDLQSSSPLVRSFLGELFTEDSSDLSKVSLRSMCFLAGQSKFYNMKPTSCYYLACLVKTIQDNQKILDLLSQVGLTVTDDAIVRRVDKEVDSFNENFWTLPKDSTVIATLDNNQADCSTKVFSVHHDSHHVDCLNQLQTCKPPGNAALSKVPKSLDDMSPDFLKLSELEIKSSKLFSESYFSQLLHIHTLSPNSDLKKPTFSDTFAIKVEDFSELVPTEVLESYRSSSNVLKDKLLQLDCYKPANECHPDFADISWSNASGNKTCLRHLELGKSVADEVYLKMVEHLFRIYKTSERDEIFVCVDQALFKKHKKLITENKMPLEHQKFVILVLDPFHFTWTCNKTLFNAYQDIGVSDLFGILGIDDKKWKAVSECQNVHKSHQLMVEISYGMASFFVHLWEGNLSAVDRNTYENLDETERAKFISESLEPFLDQIQVLDKTLSMYIDFWRGTLMVLEGWEAQRIKNASMYLHSVKSFLPYFFAFGRRNYQESSVEFLMDNELLSEYFQDLVSSGIYFDSFSSENGLATSVGYQLELFNKFIKQLSNNLDSTGTAWQRALPLISYTRTVLTNAGKLDLFSDHKETALSKQPSLVHINKFRYLFLLRNVFKADLDNFSITARDAMHIRNCKPVALDFVNSIEKGNNFLTNFVELVIEHKPKGSFDTLRQKLSLPKIVPFPQVKKTVSAAQKKLSEIEKNLLLQSSEEEAIPLSSNAMLSADNGVSLLIDAGKSDSGKFLLAEYPAQVKVSDIEFDIIAVDFMPLVFSTPPTSIYKSDKPLEEYCLWLVSTFFSKHLEQSPRLILAIDRVKIQNEFPIKADAHKKRLQASDESAFLDLACFLLDVDNSDLNLVSESHVPPHSWVTKNRNLRFELIYKSFCEILANPSKYNWGSRSFFEVYIDGVMGNEIQENTTILSFSEGLFSVSSTDFPVKLPEADQSIFCILKQLEFKTCLIKFRDNDLLLAAILNFNDMCGYGGKRMVLQYSNVHDLGNDIGMMCLKIESDHRLSHLELPVNSLIYALLCIGKNDYSGKISGMSTQIAFDALALMKEDLACPILDEDNFLEKEFPHILSSRCIFALSFEAYKSFVKLLYIVKNPSLFPSIQGIKIPTAVSSWKVNLIDKAHSVMPQLQLEDGKSTLSEKKANLKAFFESNTYAESALVENIKRHAADSVDMVSLNSVQRTVFLKKPEAKDWCPSPFQIENMYGRALIACLVFSIPESLPSKTELVNFGYVFTDESSGVLKANLETGSGCRTNVARKLVALNKRGINIESRKTCPKKRKK